MRLIPIEWDAEICEETVLKEKKKKKKNKMEGNHLLILSGRLVFPGYVPGEAMFDACWHKACQPLPPHTHLLHWYFLTDTALTWLWLPFCLLPQCFESVFLIWGGSAAVCGDGLQSQAGVFLTLLHLTRNWQLSLSSLFISSSQSSSSWGFDGCVRSMQLSCKVVFQGGKMDVLVSKLLFKNC